MAHKITAPFPFARNLRRERQQRGITYTLLGEWIGVSPGTIARWELGYCNPNDDNLAKLIAMYGTETLGVNGPVVTGKFPPIPTDEPKYRYAGLCVKRIRELANLTQKQNGGGDRGQPDNGRKLGEWTHTTKQAGT